MPTEADLRLWVWPGEADTKTGSRQPSVPRYRAAFTRAVNVPCPRQPGYWQPCPRPRPALSSSAVPSPASGSVAATSWDSAQSQSYPVMVASVDLGLSAWLAPAGTCLADLGGDRQPCVLPVVPHDRVADECKAALPLPDLAQGFIPVGPGGVALYLVGQAHQRHRVPGTHRGYAGLQALPEPSRGQTGDCPGRERLGQQALRGLHLATLEQSRQEAGRDLGPSHRYPRRRQGRATGRSRPRC